MRKNLLFAMAAGTMLLATSCQNDLDLNLSTGEDAVVSFNVTTPELVTRAYSDGSIATNLQYAVYDAEGAYLSDLDGTATFTDNKAELNLQLTTGNEYTILFWAANANAPYTVDFANRTMTVDYTNATSNAEVRDAFYTKYTFTVTGAQTENIKLYRPFAQLNIGTADLDESEVAGYKVTQSMVKVPAYNTLNLWDGTVSGLEVRTFDYEALPAGETFPVAGYEYLAMNYLLVDADKEVVDVEFSYTNGNDVKTRTVGSVPVQRNYRTNIYGSIITSEVDINVEIVPGYEEPDYVANLQYILSNGGTATLTENVSVNRPLVVKAGAKVVLDLNGYNIINNTKSEVYGEGEGIIVYGDLTINGEGTVKGSTRAVWARGDADAKVTINGGSYEGAEEGYAKGGCSVVYASSGNTINIYGGVVKALAADKTSYANKTEGVYAALNVADNNGMINVYGGRFYKQNPAAPGTEPKAWNDAHPNGFVAEGYVAKADGEYFTVTVAPAHTEVANGDELNTAITAGSNNIVATDDITLPGALSLNNVGEISINMDGNELITDSDFSINVLNDTQATIENGIFTNGFQIVYAGAKLTFNGGKIAHDIASTSGRYCFYATDGVEVIINDGEFSFGNLAKKRSYIYAGSGATVYVNGGVFGKPSTHKDYKNVPIKTAGTGKVIVTGGTFEFDPSAWVADGYVATQNGSTWTVTAN